MVFMLAVTFHVVAFAVILATFPAIPSLAMERKLSIWKFDENFQ